MSESYTADTSADTSNQNASTAEAPLKMPRQASASQKPKSLPPYHVLLLDDDDHTHEYVIEMLRALFGYAPEKGYTLAQQVDRMGRTIIYTTHKELAELKRDQIHCFGVDPRVATCRGSMSAAIVPAESDC